MNDTKVWLEDEKGNSFAIIKTEKVDMQKQLTEQISRLLEENKQLKVKNSKYKRAFEILKKKLNLKTMEYTLTYASGKQESEYSIDCRFKDEIYSTDLTEEEHNLIGELLNSIKE